jgi:hypothetical protein
MAYQSKFTGFEIDNLLSQINNIEIVEVSTETAMTDITKLYAFNGEVYRFEGEATSSVSAANSGEVVPLFTNLYKKEEVLLNTRISTAATSTMNGAMLTNWMDITMDMSIEHPVVRIKGLPHPENFGYHDYDRFVTLYNGEEHRQDNGN